MTFRAKEYLVAFFILPAWNRGACPHIWEFPEQQSSQFNLDLFPQLETALEIYASVLFAVEQNWRQRGRSFQAQVWDPDSKDDSFNGAAGSTPLSASNYCFFTAQPPPTIN